MLPKWVAVPTGLAVLLGAWFLVPREQDLIGSANRGESTQGWYEAYDLPGSDLLVFRDVDSINHVCTISRHSLRTGAEVPLPNLTRLFSVRRGYPHAATLSPDGKWLLWPTTDGYVAAMLAGTRSVEWPKRFAERLRRSGTGDNTWMGECWLGDSRHWVQLDDSGFTRLTVHCVDDPAESRVVDIPPDCRAYRGGSLAGCVAGSGDNRLAFVVWPDRTRTACIDELGLSGRTAVLTKQARIQLPEHETLSEITIGHGGQRVLWRMTRAERTWIPRALLRVIPSLGAPRLRLSLWESDGAGRNIRELAATQIMPPMPPRAGVARADDEPSGFRRLEGGTAVRFSYHQSLYELPTR